MALKNSIYRCSGKRSVAQGDLGRHFAWTLGKEACGAGICAAGNLGSRIHLWQVCGGIILLETTFVNSRAGGLRSWGTFMKAQAGNGGAENLGSHIFARSGRNLWRRLISEATSMTLEQETCGARFFFGSHIYERSGGSSAAQEDLRKKYRTCPSVFICLKPFACGI